MKNIILASLITASTIAMAVSTPAKAYCFVNRDGGVVTYDCR